MTVSDDEKIIDLGRVECIECIDRPMYPEIANEWSIVFHLYSGKNIEMKYDYNSTRDKRYLEAAQALTSYCESKIDEK